MPGKESRSGDKGREMGQRKKSALVYFIVILVLLVIVAICAVLFLMLGHAEISIAITVVLVAMMAFIMFYSMQAMAKKG